MSIVEHALDWSKLAELLPQLGREYHKHALQYRLILTILALLPPLLLPLEAAKWFSDQLPVLGGFIFVYVVLAFVIFQFTGKWVENVRSFGVERIAEDELLARTLDRIERDAGKSGEMTFEEIYLTDGSGLERRTRKHIIYAENEIEVNMDRGQLLFANNNIPLMINTAIVILYCLYTIVGGFFLPYDAVEGQDVMMMIQQAMLLAIPLAIFYIQSHFRQHLLNEVLAEELLGFITDDDARESEVSAMQDEPGTTQDADPATDGIDTEEDVIDILPENRQADDPGEESVQAQT